MPIFLNIAIVSNLPIIFEHDSMTSDVTTTTATISDRFLATAQKAVPPNLQEEKGTADGNEKDEVGPLFRRHYQQSPTSFIGRFVSHWRSGLFVAASLAVIFALYAFEQQDFELHNLKVFVQQPNFTVSIDQFYCINRSISPHNSINFTVLINFTIFWSSPFLHFVYYYLFIFVKEYKIY